NYAFSGGAPEPAGRHRLPLCSHMGGSRPPNPPASPSLRARSERRAPVGSLARAPPWTRSSPARENLPGGTGSRGDFAFEAETGEAVGAGTEEAAQGAGEGIAAGGAEDA